MTRARSHKPTDGTTLTTGRNDPEPAPHEPNPAAMSPTPKALSADLAQTTPQRYRYPRARARRLAPADQRQAQPGPRYYPAAGRRPPDRSVRLLPTLL